ncbi:MAG: hypothetical protein U1F06_02005 [Steroidobacteraceae bacterium]
MRPPGRWPSRHRRTRPASAPRCAAGARRTPRAHRLAQARRLGQRAGDARRPLARREPRHRRRATSRAVLERRYGVPRSAAGARPLVIVGMGKLGGGELNFSSDVDTGIPVPGGRRDRQRTRRRQRGVLHAPPEQMVIRLLDAPTEEAGLARRHALAALRRQRPAGGELRRLRGLPAAAQGATGSAAWIKARAITGIEAYAELFRNVVRPVRLPRRYLDGVFDSLREMKGMIEREVARRELADNIKLGAGGIREIEFIVQAFPAGARWPGPAATRPAHACGKCCRSSPATSCCRRRWSPRCSRYLPVPAAAGEQPADARRPPDARAARRYGRAGAHRAGDGADGWRRSPPRSPRSAVVAAHFRDIVFAGGDAGGAGAQVQAARCRSWEPGLAPGQLAARLAALGYAEADDAARLLGDFTDSPRCGGSTPPAAGGSRRCCRCWSRRPPEAGPERPAASRLLGLLESIRARSALSLLGQNARAPARGWWSWRATATSSPRRSRRIRCCSTSSRSEEPARASADRRTLAADLAQRMAGSAAEADEERVVEQLRHFSARRCSASRWPISPAACR